MTSAKSLWHPFDELRHPPDLLTKAIYNVLSRSKIDIPRERLATLRKWRDWADELQEPELSLKNNMEPHVRKVMSCERVLLLNKLATEVLDWPDKFCSMTFAMVSDWWVKQRQLGSSRHSLKYATSVKRNS